MKKSINGWRAATVVLVVLALGMAYTIATLLMQREAEARRVPAMVAASESQGEGEGYAVEIKPRWPDVQLEKKETPPKLDLAHDYDFDRDWHTRHAGYWEQALERYKGKPDVKYLEIGLFEGASFFWMLEKILTDPTATATGIDPFIREYSKIKNYGDTFYENLELSGQKDRTTIIEGFSQVELRKLPLESFDIIYIDGSHKAHDVLEDAILSWRLLKRGGILIFDDYELWWERPPPDRPRHGIDVFYAFYRRAFKVTHFGYQVMLEKR